MAIQIYKKLEKKKNFRSENRDDPIVLLEM